MSICFASELQFIDSYAYVSIQSSRLYVCTDFEFDLRMRKTIDKRV